MQFVGEESHFRWPHCGPGCHRRKQGLSLADLIQLAGAHAVKMTGGPAIPVPVGRKDASVADPPGRIPGEGFTGACLRFPNSFRQASAPRCTDAKRASSQDTRLTPALQRPALLPPPLPLHYKKNSRAAPCSVRRRWVLCPGDGGALWGAYDWRERVRGPGDVRQHVLQDAAREVRRASLGRTRIVGFFSREV